MQDNPGFAAGKQPERLKVSSGFILVIDQFMLANAQFLALLPERGEGQSAADWVGPNKAKIAQAVSRYGGVLLPLENSDWGVERDPGECVFVISRLTEVDSAAAHQAADLNVVLEARGNASPIGQLFIDTRCVVFADAGVLFDLAVLDRYTELRKAGQDKGARDFIREHGAAVRYGFNRNGDELGVFRLPDDSGYAFWPDVVEDENFGNR